MTSKTKARISFTIGVLCMIAIAIWLHFHVGDQAHDKYLEVHSARINGEIVRTSSNSGGVAVRVANSKTLYYFIPTTIPESYGTTFSREAKPGTILVKEANSDTIVLVTKDRTLMYLCMRLD